MEAPCRNSEPIHRQNNFRGIRAWKSCSIFTRYVKNIYTYICSQRLINDPFSLKRRIVIILFERWQPVEIDVYRCISGLYLNTAVLMSRIRVDLISWNNRLITL